MTATSDIAIVGAGIIGLSLALELRLRGHDVTVVERGTSLGEASTAAAGMLAVEDPHNPSELRPLARLSASLYPAFLARVEGLSGRSIPFQTAVTWQNMPDGARTRLPEHSLDPRQLAPALRRAALYAGVQLIEGADVQLLRSFSSNTLIYTAGAWSPLPGMVFPRKGQMLRVRLPQGFALEEVHRSEQVYVVPRTQGPQAGTALIGATVEDAGFDKSTDPASLAALRALGATLVPALQDPEAAPLIEAWAGLRPATTDSKPILGELTGELTGSLAAGPGQRTLVATGHFRNGILLAPATAVVMADLVEQRAPQLDLNAFSPARFLLASTKVRVSA